MNRTVAYAYAGVVLTMFGFGDQHLMQCLILFNICPRYLLRLNVFLLQV